MKRLTTLCLIAVLGAAPALADPITGMWRTAPDDHGDIGFIKMAACGQSLCGTLERAEDSKGKTIHPPTIGRKIVWDLKPDGKDEYKGRIYAPDRNTDYLSWLKLTGDKIAVSGCILGGLICRNGGEWTRVK